MFANNPIYRWQNHGEFNMVFNSIAELERSWRRRPRRRRARPRRLAAEGEARRHRPGDRRPPRARGGRVVDSRDRGVGAIIGTPDAGSCRSGGCARVRSRPGDLQRQLAFGADAGGGGAPRQSSRPRRFMRRGHRRVRLWRAGHRRPARPPARRDMLALGDLAYMQGTAANFRDCYDPAWGRHLDRTRPVPGNHEYQNAAARRVTTIISAGWPGREARAITRSPPARGGSSRSTASCRRRRARRRTQWLRDELETNRTQCTLAYWHRPLFSSGPNGNNPDIRHALAHARSSSASTSC